jgi:hypothetical protein
MHDDPKRVVGLIQLLSVAAAAGDAQLFCTLHSCLTTNKGPALLSFWVVALLMSSCIYKFSTQVHKVTLY